MKDKFKEYIDKPVQINLDKVIEKKYKVFIATPCYGGMLTEGYHRSMMFTLQKLYQHRIPFQLGSLTNESLVTRARNTLVSMFLDSDCTHLMFIDSDISFNGDYIIKMLWDTLRDDVEIVTGAYPKKGINWESIIDAVKDGHTDPATIENHNINYVINFKDDGEVNLTNGLAELRDAGTGFMLIKKTAIEKIIKKYKRELQYTPDFRDWPKDKTKNFYALFDTGIEGKGLLKQFKKTNRYLSEDYFFCRLAQSLDIKIWYDPRIVLYHHGYYEFKGTSSVVFKVKDQNGKA